MNTTAIAAAVAGVDGVVSARVWDKYAGRERVYVTLVGVNGVSRAVGGAGVEGYIELATMSATRTDARNQASIQYHRDNGTWDAMKAAIRAAMTTGSPALTPEEEAEKEDHIR